MPLGPQAMREVGHLEIGLLEGFQLGQLAADMDVDAHHLDPRQGCGFGIDLGRAGDGDAELVVLLAGGDLFMGAGVHIRIDADGDRRGHAQRHGHLGQGAQFGFAFHVELPDAPGQGQPHLFARLADAGEYDPFPRHAGGAGAAVFPARNHIHPGAEVAQQFQHCQVGQRLDGKADHMRQRRQRLGEQMVMPRQGGRGIDVEGRADRGRDVG